MKHSFSFGMTIDDIANKHKVSTEHIEKQIDMGWPQEAKEHGLSEDTAKHVSRDHLVEDADYYTKLKKIETSNRVAERLVDYLGRE